MILHPLPSLYLTGLDLPDFPFSLSSFSLKVLAFWLLEQSVHLPTLGSLCLLFSVWKSLPLHLVISYHADFSLNVSS